MEEKYEKVLILLAHLQISSELMDEVGYLFPEINRHKIKQKGENYREAIGQVLKTALAADKKPNDRLKSVSGEDIGTVTEIQLQFNAVVELLIEGYKLVHEQTFYNEQAN